jgi:hypothetical protein
MENDTVTLLCSIYQEIYGTKITMANLNNLADDLSLIAKRNRPWTGKFLHSLIKRYPGFIANGQLTAALTVLAARLDGLDEVQAQAKEVTVWAVNDLPGETVILGKARRCATPGCQVWFVPSHPRQKYHSKGCSRINRGLKQR